MHYDPILSKVIVWGPDREIARRRMLSALSDTVILGIRTTVSFLHDVIAHPQFEVGNTHTDFVDRHMLPWNEQVSGELLEVILAAAAIDAHRRTGHQTHTSARLSGWPSPWQTGGAWRIGGA
jgi:acetyl/propionyl-CoA carboxylase alpha subunit